MSQQYPPQQPWHPSQYSQPTQSWQQPPLLVPSLPNGKPPKKPKKPMTKREKIVGFGCLGAILLLFCGICGSVASAMGGNHNVSPSSPSPTATSAQQAAITVTTVQPTDTPTPTPTQKPTPTPTAKPTPTPSPTQVVIRPTPTPTQVHCVAVNNNPWCYNFSPGNLIDYPPSGFCSYFNCIPTFYGSDDPGDGYIIECQDGTYSQSGGESGACSYHGGEMRPLYSH